MGDLKRRGNRKVPPDFFPRLLLFRTDHAKGPSG